MALSIPSRALRLRAQKHLLPPDSAELLTASLLLVPLRRLQREILRSLSEGTLEQDLWYLEIAVFREDSERVDGLREFFLTSWQHTKSALTKIGETIVRHAEKGIRIVSGRSPFTAPGTGAAVDAFRGSTVHYFRQVLRAQIDDVRSFVAANGHLSPIDMRAGLMDRFHVYKNRSVLVGRNQTLVLNAEINKQRQQASGITHYIWTTCLDDRVRPRHQMLEAQICDWLVAPDPGYHPGEDINCRCIAFPILERSDIGVFVDATFPELDENGG